ncbi:hypothetical protein [Nocardioides aequoreus]|uniref:hypothetical protein n=1 Tax=Nocardioides aequoreus TaxID=397278 RepID=UPI0012F67299|nr:hypothetical protein [Nocardioides aequoreus]
MPSPDTHAATSPPDIAAARPSAQRRYGPTFLLPVLAIVLGDGIWSDGQPTGATYLAVAALTVAAGAVWQLLARRDLVDRLTHVAALYVALAVLLATSWGSAVSVSGSGVGLGGVLTGLVIAEQWLRHRDWRRARRSSASDATDAPSTR